ncbi:alpha beta hydrolase fold-3 domain protein [Colletotrichum truncatum]|uniref:Alpha beta hydrolase fold-3 domain protein n=1 Tax=Colletotrichum truncatum TaxID=5467 RepID=A0ACC3YSJ5_COLTU|nr:alpha beta hydrolase fold-3 domain protein [Colletotrichum truncatum]KAF6789732.1 alpha beta hydrolase fold-3 domain protein [Colletotrichum truncatum]
MTLLDLTKKDTVAKPSIPEVGTRTTLDPSISSFLSENPNLRLGGREGFTSERAEHLKVFGFHALEESLRAPIEHVEYNVVRGPYGTIPIRIFYPYSGRQSRDHGNSPALVYMHGGGYTVGSVDEFENGLRLIAEESGAVVIGVEYRLAPEWSYPVQLDEYDAVVDWLHGGEARNRGINPDRVCGGGDSAGGNMTAALTLRRKDQEKKPLKACFLLYPEARLPFDTKAVVENNSGLYLESNGIFGFAAHYATRGVPPSHRYISPGMQKTEYLTDLPPTAIFTCGFDPLRDVGVEFAHKLEEAENTVSWRHFDTLTHGFLQMAPWSEEAMKATKLAASELKKIA